MGLKVFAPLSPTGPPSPSTQGWVTSQIVPFAGRLVTERIQCGITSFVRFFIVGRSPVFSQATGADFQKQNDALQQPTFCKGTTRSGLCPLDAFIASQAYSTGNGNGQYAQVGHLTHLVSTADKLTSGTVRIHALAGARVTNEKHLRMMHRISLVNLTTRSR